MRAEMSMSMKFARKCACIDRSASITLAHSHASTRKCSDFLTFFLCRLPPLFDLCLPSHQSETLKHEPPRKCESFCASARSLEHKIRTGSLTIVYLHDQNTVRMYAREHKRTHAHLLFQRYRPGCASFTEQFETIVAKAALGMSSASSVDITRNDATKISPVL